jgi:hypothetical protein
MLPLGDEREIRPARHHDIEAVSRQRLMRARGAPQVGALDDEIVLRKDSAIDPDLQWHEGNCGRNGDADAQLLGGCGRSRKEICHGGQRDSSDPKSLPVVPTFLCVVLLTRNQPLSSPRRR